MTNHQKCLNELFTRHYGELIAYSSGRVDRRLGEPEDFVHFAYLKCCRGWSSDRRSQRSEKAYLYRALRWVIYDAHRKQARRTRFERELGLPGRPTDSASQLPWLVAKEAFERLRGRQRAVCDSVLQGTSADQTCRDLKITRNALAVFLSRAKMALKAALC